MPNPVFVDCPVGTWQIVATSVVSGQIWRASLAPDIYIHTYRLTGDPAPTERSEGTTIFVDTEREVEYISASLPIDVYIYAVGDAGRVRVDVA